MLFSEDVRKGSEPAAPGFYDLEALLEEVRREYFPFAPSLPIRWGRRVQRKRRTSIRLGSYHRPSLTITIHPSLDAPSVPRFFVKSIIHHEYLHHIVGPDHDQEFHRFERSYSHYRESKQWLRTHIHSLLGRRAPRPQRREVPFVPAAATARPTQLALF